jgi:hypothetical protein
MAGVARERTKAGAWGLLFSGLLAILIITGSRGRRSLA